MPEDIVKEQKVNPVVMEDGVIVDPETGEILGWQDQPAAEPGQDLSEFVSWSLERRARASARMAGLAAERKALIDGVAERFDRRIKDEQRRIEWIDRSAGPAFRQYAAERLEGGKKKSLVLNWGTLGFRDSKGRTVVDDERTAAKSLVGAEMTDAITVTISLADLAAAEKEDIAVGLLLTMLRDLLDRGQVQVMPSIKASQLPDDLDGIEGIHREKGDGFYVKH